MQLSRGQLNAYLLRKLGQPFFKVELDEDQLNDAVVDALLCYSRWKPVRLYRAFAGQNGILKLDSTTTPAVPVGANGILDWSFVNNLAQGNPNIESQMLSGTFAYYGVRSPLYDLRFLEYQREWIRFAGKALNSYPDLAFRLNEETGVPTLWLYSPGAATDFDVTFSMQHTPDLKSIPDFDEPRIKGLALAAAKKTLGQIRSKYDKILVANTTMQLNGPALVTEGEEEWNAEESRLIKSVADQIPIWV